MKRTVSILFFTLLLLGTSTGFSNGLILHENKGQWKQNILFKADLNNGALFIEKNKLTFVVHQADELQALKNKIHGNHQHLSTSKSFRSDKHQHSDSKKNAVQSHAFSIRFQGANAHSATMGQQAVKAHRNYYLGNDPDFWASEVKGYRLLRINNLYNNIDFVLYSKGNHIKYEFILHPGADANQIKMAYDGINELQLRNQQIIIRTAAGKIIDESPYSYYLNSDSIINTQFKIYQNTVTFAVSPYDKSTTLVLDPSLNFASFTGSTVDNWGFTATYDEAGNAYAGGVVFGTGYPVTLGAFQTFFGGGTHGPYVQEFAIDISISKFTSDGSQLIYSTYLGGSKQDSPHSLVVNSNNELIVFGTTSSLDYPTTINAFDRTFNGGDTVIVDHVLQYEGTDIITSKFSSDGSNLLGSTYFGGSENDGFNDENYISGLQHNYSDIFRGEVISDVNNNIYIATSTASLDLPIVNGFQTTFGGGDQDGCLVKFNSDLSQVIWSSYLGGNSSDGVYGLQANSSEELYVTGGTSSIDFPINNGFQTTHNGGTDGFVARISNAGSSLLGSSFIGTSAYDQGYFVQIDLNDKVFVYGQTSGNMPISPGTYNNLNSGQFLHKYSTDLSNLELSTVVGSGSGNTDIVPSAFLVSHCGQIYLSGWGGQTNLQYGGGTTNGLPVTADAQQSSTDGSDFYLMVLNEDFQSLNYATYFGSNVSAEHVDGGTSRFDKNGIVYQAVCAACGNTTAFPTTPGAYAETMNSPNCNLAVFKFDASKLTAVINPQTDSLVCKGDSIHFLNESNGGTEFEWIFHDGTSSTEREVYKAFDTAGVYQVILIVKDPSECPGIDTTFMNFRVQELHVPQISFTDSTICEGDEIFIDLGDNETYNLLINNQVTSTFTAATTLLPDSNTSYLITSNTVECPDSVGIDVNLLPVPIPATHQTNICSGDTAGFPIAIHDNYQYTWLPDSPLFINRDTAFFAPTDSTMYQVTTTGECGTAIQSFNFAVTNIQPISTPDTTVCNGDTLPLHVDGGDTYTWTPAVNGAEANNPNPVFIADSSRLFLIDIQKNNCQLTDSIQITVLAARPVGNAYNSSICDYEQASFPFPVQSDFTYEWIPNSGVSVVGEEVQLSPDSSTNYLLNITGECGTASVTYDVDVTVIFDSIMGNFTACIGDSISLFAGGGDRYVWSPEEALTDPYSKTPELLVESDQLFLVDINKGNCSKARAVNMTTFSKKPQTSDQSYTIDFGETQALELLDDYSYSWTPSTYLSCTECSKPVSAAEEDILYYFTYTDENNCSITDSIQVNVVFELYVPNAFTPEGINEVFYAYSHVVKEFHMDIFDRWGEKIFTSDDLLQGWDGTVNGTVAQQDVYVWKITYVKIHTNKPITRVGTVTLVR